MKKYILLLIVIMFGLTLFSQDKKNEKKEWKQKTFFKDDSSKGGYTGLSVGLSQIDSNYSYIVGLRFVSTSSHWISYGMDFNGIFSYPINNNDTSLTNYIGGYGGFILIPTILSRQRIHLTFPITVGGGWIGDFNLEDYVRPIGNEISFVYIEPGLELEFNMSERFRLSFGGYYNYKFDLDIPEHNQLNSDIMNRVNFKMVMKWGIF